MDLSLGSGWAPAKAFLVQAVLCSFQQREAFFYIPSSLIVDCHFFPSLNTMRLQSEFAAEAWYCQFSSGTKGCFMASMKGEKRARQTWSSVGQDEQQYERQKCFKNSPCSLLFTFILMANLLSSVLHKMIRARCFLKSANF